MAHKYTYTYGTTPEGVIREQLEQLPGHYELSLTPGDMVTLLMVLNGDTDERTDEWSMSFRSSILETLDIEEI